MLKNSMRALRDQKALCVTYLGGSITEGAGASAPEHCWRAQTTAWLRAQYPDCAITEVNAGIGGTDSYFGACRCAQQVIAHRPELVFVEFAVNDRDRAESVSTMEAIVRKLLRYDPCVDIVLVLTATQAMAQEIAQNGFCRSAADHCAVAAHYGIGVVNVGAELLRRAALDPDTWKKYTTDTVHPNDAGYDIYTARIAEFLRANLALPAPLSRTCGENAAMIDAADAEYTGFRLAEEMKMRDVTHYLESDRPGDRITVRFSGRSVQVYALIASDSGMFTWRIDDGPVQTKNSWDKYALHFDRTGCLPLADDLAPGVHTLTICPTGTHDPQSTGSFVRIAAVLTM